MIALISGFPPSRGRIGRSRGDLEALIVPRSGFPPSRERISRSRGDHHHRTLPAGGPNRTSSGFSPRPAAREALIDVEPLRVALAWLEGEDSSLVRRFAGVVREVAG
jgi:hypothetical protein